MKKLVGILASIAIGIALFVAVIVMQKLHKESAQPAAG